MTPITANNQLPNELAPLVEPARDTLACFFKNRIHQALSPAYQEMWISLRDATTGGKLIRPLLVMIAATGGDLARSSQLTQKAASVGAAFELLHSGFLIHDDIMDRDTIRRGSPTVAAHFRKIAANRGSTDSLHQGEAAAIIVGDLALTAAFRMLADCGTKTNQLIEVVDQAMRLTAEGQFRDVSDTNLPIEDIPELLNLAYLKTCAYSFEAPLRCGMVLAGWDASSVETVKSGAHDLGIAFQVIDDILGVAGDPKITGKSIDSDLISRKHTTITAYAAKDSRWHQVWIDLAHDQSPELLAKAHGLLEQTEAISQARLLAAKLHASARKCFNSADVPIETSRLLVALTNWLEGRQK